MYENILEYIVNADDFYRLWMVGEIQNPTRKNMSDKSLPITHPREEWMPELVEQFDDIRTVPYRVSCIEANHHVNKDMQFHTGNKTPSIACKTLTLWWGATRESGPITIVLSNLKMWHHEDTVHRRRGDAVICETATFQWNNPGTTLQYFRNSGPFQVVIKNFRASYNMGEVIKAEYGQINNSWGNERGIRIAESVVKKVINENGIKVSPLATDSVFGSATDEFLFWDEIGRARKSSLGI